MWPQILIEINNFIKNRLIELLGVLLIFVSIFLLASIVSYSPSDPNFIYTQKIQKLKMLEDSMVVLYQIFYFSLWD